MSGNLRTDITRGVIWILYLISQSFIISAHGQSRPSPEKADLPNGLQIYHYDNTRPENQCDIRLVIKSGTLDETDRGASIALSRMHHKHFHPQLRNLSGRPNVPYDAFSFVNPDYTLYKIAVKDCDTDKVNEALEILLKIATGTAIADADLEAIKKEGVPATEYTEQYVKNYWPILMNATPYQKAYPELDTATLNALTIDQIAAAANRYSPEKSAVIISGNADYDIASQLVEERFGRWTAAAHSAPDTAWIFAPSDQYPELHWIPDTTSNLITGDIIYRIPQSDGHRDLQSMLSDQVIQLLLNKRLSVVAGKSDAPLINAGITLANAPVHGMAFHSLKLNATASNIDKAVISSVAEVSRLKQRGISEEELHWAMKAFADGIRQMDEQDSVLYFEHAADKITDYYIYGNPFISGGTFKKVFEAYQKTISPTRLKEHIHKLFDQYEPMLIFRAPEVLIDTLKQTTDLVSGYKYAEAATPLTPFIHPDLITNPIPDLPNTGSILSKNTSEHSGIIKYELSNGATVYYKHEPLSSQTFIQAIREGGMQSFDKGDYPEAYILTDVISKMAVGPYTPKEWSTIIDNDFISTRTYISNYYDGLTAMYGGTNYASMVQQVFLQFNPQKQDKILFDKAIEEMIAHEVKLKGYMRYKRQLSDLKLLNPDNPGIAIQQDPDQIREAQMEKVFNLYKQHFGGGAGWKYMITGRIPVDELEVLLQKYIATLTGSEQRIEPKGIRLPDKAWHVIAAPSPKVQRVLINYKSKVEVREETLLQLELLKHLLQLKTDSLPGLCKSSRIYCNAHTYPEPHVIFNIEFGNCQSGPTKAVITGLKSIIGNLSTIAESDFTKAKQNLTAEYQKRMKSDSYTSNQMQYYVQNGFDLNKLNGIKQAIQAVTADELLQLTGQVFNPSNEVIIEETTQ